MYLWKYYSRYTEVQANISRILIAFSVLVYWLILCVFDDYKYFLFLNR